MKKNLTLILAITLCISALAGLTAFADSSASANSTEASPEIAYVNVSTKANVCLLFAVPVDDINVAYNDDGSIDNLELYIWKAPDPTGNYYVSGATEKLEAQGNLVNGGKNYAVFSYDGLSAKEMTDVIYACVSYISPETNVRHFSKIIDYSIAEWAMNYTTTDAKNQRVVDALLAYGGAMQTYKKYNPNGYRADAAKSLKTLTVNSYLDGVLVQTQVTQLYKSKAEITLAVPALKNATFVKWENVEDSNTATEGIQIKSAENTEVNAIFTTKSLVGETIWSDGFEAYASTGIFKDNTEKAKGYNLVNSTTSVRVNTGDPAYKNGNRDAVGYKIVADGDNKYITYMSTAGGALYVNKDAHDAIYLKKYGVGDAVTSITVKISIKRNEAGTVLNTAGIRIRANGTGHEESLRILDTFSDGKSDGENVVRLKTYNGKKHEYAVIGSVAEKGFTDFAVVVDILNLEIRGYIKVNGEYEHTATLPLYVPSNYSNVYDWMENVIKVQLEGITGSIDSKYTGTLVDAQWDNVVTEAERNYLESLKLDDAAYKAELFRLVEKYYSMDIDNYKIELGDSVSK